MHRKKIDFSGIDPMNVSEKTLSFKKTQPKQIQKFYGIKSKNEIKSSKELKDMLLENTPEFLKKYAESEKFDEELNSVNNKIQLEKKSHEKIKQKLDYKSKSLRKAKKMLNQSQRELEDVVSEEYHKFEDKKLETIGKMSSKMAHDIRNPLTVLKTQIDLMKIKQQKQEDEVLSTSLSKMESAINSITNQIDDVMDFIRKPQLEISSCDLKKIIDDSIDEIVFPKEIDLELYVNPCIINCDEIKIKGIITNILKNGVEAIKSTGRISLMLNENVETVEIKISDSGFGIPNENFDKIFDPMFTTKKTGTGLGLASCKQLLEMHGGTITVKNYPTTFTITLPKQN